MASRTITTVEELKHKSAPILTLRLRQPQPGQASKSQSNWAWLQSFFTATSNNLELEQSPDEAATQRNSAKIDKIFDGVQDTINKQRDTVKEEMKSMTPEQQEEVITYWHNVQEFLSEVLDWLKEMFQIVLQKIREGYRIEKQALNNIFKTVLDAFKQGSSSGEDKGAMAQGAEPAKNAEEGPICQGKEDLRKTSEDGPNSGGANEDNEAMVQGAEPAKNAEEGPICQGEEDPRKTGEEDRINSGGAK